MRGKDTKIRPDYKMVIKKRVFLVSLWYEKSLETRDIDIPTACGAC